jgi:hypothetical protein
MIVPINSSTFDSEYNSRKFKPRDDMIERVAPGLVDQVVARMNAKLQSFLDAEKVSVPP